MRILRIVLISVILFFALLRLKGDRLVYRPVRFPGGSWEMAKECKGFEDCIFTTQDNVKLHGWLFSDEPGEKVILWCHGNTGNITHRFDQIKLFQHFGFSVFIFDYRGYGKSEGRPDEQGIYKDTIAAYEYLTDEKSIAPERIVLYGRSMGGAAAIYLAQQLAKNDVAIKALIIESTWTSGNAIVKNAIGFTLPWAAIPSRFPSFARIKSIKAPLMIIHGKKDEIIPFRQAENLFQSAQSTRKVFYAIEGAGHEDGYLVAGLDYFRKIRKFVDELR